MSCADATHPLLSDMRDGDDYFVHSYCIRPSNRAHVLAATNYGGEIAGVVGRDNIIGTQFHPEKSQARTCVLERFLRWRP